MLGEMAKALSKTDIVTQHNPKPFVDRKSNAHTHKKVTKPSVSIV